MKEMIKGIAIGWLLFNSSGQKMVNKFIKHSINRAKKSLLTPELSSLLDFKDLFIDNNDNSQNHQDINFNQNKEKTK